MSTLQNMFVSNKEDENSSKYLTFKVDEQVFGLSIQNVIEIIKAQPATMMPELPVYAKGIINLRGRVIPIIDLNLRFGKPEKEYNERTCIVIVDIAGLHVGFVVDEVREVLDIVDSEISPPPAFAYDRATRYVIGIGKMPDYLVLILEGSRLLTDDEKELLENAVEEE